MAVQTPARPVATARPIATAALDEQLRRWSPHLMRWALGLVFVWFGALKVANVTPVATLVADTLAFVPLPAEFVLPALGVFEIAAGLALMAGVLMRPVLAVLV